MTNALYERTTSPAGVSVGTSMALEAVLRDWPIFDSEKKTAFTPIETYGEVWINLSTLFRNLTSAVNSDARYSLNTTEVGAALVEECIAVRDAIRTNSRGATAVVFYLCSYDAVGRDFVSSQTYKPTTPKQIYYFDLQKKVLKYVVQALNTNATKESRVKEFNWKLTPELRKETLMITHYPIDLLSHERFGSLALLESHTAIIKKRNLWYTKLHNGKELAQIPFNGLALQVFGDGVHFRPLDGKVKQAILDISTKKNWSWMTSSSYQRQAIAQLPDQFFAQMLLKML